MTIDEVLKNPMLKRALSVGEERMGRLVTQLLSSERVMHGLQAVVSSALNAKSTLDRGVKTAMQAVNLPTAEDVDDLRRKLAELEALLDGLAARVNESEKSRGGANGANGQQG
ncbi:MAG TPA: hypothetical protein VIH11_08240 [Gemmatimonadaceae bacterium]|jgi:hypothetical protein